MNFKSSLTPELLEKAKIELGETDAKREQALQELKDWIKSNKKIKRCREDDIFLLRILRFKKYSFLNATKMLEEFLTCPQMYPNYFQKIDPMSPAMLELVDSGYMVLLPSRDSSGCRIVMLRPSAINVDRFTACDSVKLSTVISEIIADEEETQICGLKVIFDFSNAPLKFFTTFSFSDLRNIAKLSQSNMALRQKGYYVLNLPAYANTVLHFMISLLSEKLKNRIHFLNDPKELSKHMDINILPEQYGGKIKVEDAAKNLRNKFKENAEMLEWLNLNHMDLVKESSSALNSNSDMDPVTIGSFRKLELD